MASIASFRLDDRQRSSPLTLHPAFPAFVALWFAALLGFGSLILPTILLDRLVDAAGLAAIVPAASPPLGFTARMMVALLAGLGGGALGLAIARRIALQARPANARTARAAAGTRRPLRVHEDLGGAGLKAEMAPLPGRRRAALFAEGTGASGAPQGDPPPPPEEDPEPEPLELSDLAADELTEPRSDRYEPCLTSADEEAPLIDQDPQAAYPARAAPGVTAAAPAAAPVAALHLDASDWRDAPAEPEAGSVSAEGEPRTLDESSPLDGPAVEAEAEPRPQIASDAAPVLKPVPGEPAPASFQAQWVAGPLDDLGLVQLVQRLGSAIERRRVSAAETPRTPVPPPVPATGVEVAAAEEAARAMAAYFGTAPVRAPESETIAPAPASAPAPEPAAEPASPAELTPAPAMPERAEPGPPPGLRPAFLSGLASAAAEDQDGDELDDPFPTFTLPLRRPAQADASGPRAIDEASDDLIDEAWGEEAGDEDNERSEEGYRSLLSLRSPVTGEKKFVRFGEDDLSSEEGGDRAEDGHRLFDPPGRVPAAPHSVASQARPQDPAQAAPAPGPEADAALRAALATLQRMSGTTDTRF